MTRTCLAVLCGLLLFLTSGCVGYAICRLSLNSEEQCKYDCTWDYELDEQGRRIPDPLGRPGEYKLKKTCVYNLEKVLFT